MTEKSGIEILQELLLEVQTLRKELKVLDYKIAQIANSTKMAELIDRASNTKLEQFVKKPKVEAAMAPVEKVKPSVQPVVPSGVKQFSFEPSDAAKMGPKPPTRDKRDVKTTLVSGKMIVGVDGKEVALSGLNVKIYDTKDKVIKDTKTNKGGLWMCHLIPGKYVANIEGKFKDKDLVPVNLKFEVKEGMEKLEVK